MKQIKAWLKRRAVAMVFGAIGGFVGLVLLHFISKGL